MDVMDAMDAMDVMDGGRGFESMSSMVHQVHVVHLRGRGSYSTRPRRPAISAGISRPPRRAASKWGSESSVLPTAT